MKPIRRLRLVFLLVLASVCHGQDDGGFPECFACGCATCEVGNPRGVIKIPEELQGLVGNLETITCFQMSQAGLGRLLPESICALSRQISFRSTCQCPQILPSFDEEVQPITSPPSLAPTTKAPSVQQHPTMTVTRAPVVPPTTPASTESSTSKKSKKVNQHSTKKSKDPDAFHTISKPANAPTGSTDDSPPHGSRSDDSYSYSSTRRMSKKAKKSKDVLSEKKNSKKLHVHIHDTRQPRQLL